MYEYIAFILLLSPVEIYSNSYASPEMWQGLKAATQTLDIVGPTEHWNPSFKDELKYCRHWCRVLADAPPSCDVMRMPRHEVTTANMTFSVAYGNYCTKQAEDLPDRSGAWKEALVEAEQYQKVYSLVHKSVGANTCVERRNAMNQLRKSIGEEAYYRGDWPPCVPVHRFRSID